MPHRPTRHLIDWSPPAQRAAILALVRGLPPEEAQALIEDAARRLDARGRDTEARVLRAALPAPHG